MNSRKAYSMLLGFLITIASVVAHGQPDGSSVPGDYGQRVQMIVASLKDPNFNDELFVHPLMKEVFDHPGQFLADAQAYLTEVATLTRTEARVAVSALQCAKLGQYLGFLDSLSNAGRGRVNEWTIYYAVSPGFEWSTRLATRFREKKVHNALRRIARSPNATAGVRDAIAHILDGTAAKYIEREKFVPTLQCPVTR